MTYQSCETGLTVWQTGHVSAKLQDPGEVHCEKQILFHLIHCITDVWYISQWRLYVRIYSVKRYSPDDEYKTNWKVCKSSRGLFRWNISASALCDWKIHEKKLKKTHVLPKTRNGDHFNRVKTNATWAHLSYDRSNNTLDMIYDDVVYLLTAIGLTPGGSSTVHIYIQAIHRTTQWNRI